MDIETSPNLAMVWGLWQQTVTPAAVLESTEILCWAAKWIGDKQVIFRSTFHDDKEVMIADVWELLDDSDAVVHYNGQKFDMPHISTEFIRAGMEPPSPYQQIDLLKTVRKAFNFPSNKLALVSKELGLEGKIENEGFPLWRKCMNNDPDAWERMKEYNIRDVEMLEPLYLKLRPWATSLPSFAAMAGEDLCPACGSDKLELRGSAYTRTGKYQRFRCKECSKWSRATKRTSGTGVV